MIKITFLWAGALSIVFSLLYLGGNNMLLSALTNKHDVIAAASPFLPWVIIIPLVTFPAFIWDGVYIGATASKQMRNVMIVATVVFFFPVYYFSRGSLGNHGLWLAFIVMMLSRSFLMTLMAKKVIPD
jgi:MATE family multidrug resistance protein